MHCINLDPPAGPMHDNDTGWIGNLDHAIRMELLRA